MLSRLPLLALVMLGACHTAEEAPDAPSILVGTWERRLSAEESRTSAAAQSEVLVRTETFHADGRWTALVEGSTHCGNFPRESLIRDDGVAYLPLLEPVEIRGEWHLVDAQPNRIEVYIRCRARDQDHAAMQQARSIGEGSLLLTVNGPDDLALRMYERDGRLVRVQSRPPR